MKMDFVARIPFRERRRASAPVKINSTKPGFLSIENQ